MTQKLTQAQRILRAFKESNNTLTPLDMIRLGIAQYNARVKELRESGYQIDNEYLGTVNGVKHTQFILRSEPKKYKSSPLEKPEGFHSRAHQISYENNLKKTGQPSLF